VHGVAGGAARGAAATTNLDTLRFHGHHTCPVGRTPSAASAASVARGNPRHGGARLGGQGCARLVGQECAGTTQGPGCVCGQELELWTRLEWGAPRTGRAPSAASTASAARCNPRHRGARLGPSGQECACTAQGPGCLCDQELESWTKLEWGAPRTGRAPSAASAARCNPRHTCARLGGQELQLWTRLEWGAPRTGYTRRPGGGSRYCRCDRLPTPVQGAAGPTHQGASKCQGPPPPSDGEVGFTRGAHSTRAKTRQWGPRLHCTARLRRPQ